MGEALHVACFATLGSGSREEQRIAQLLAPLKPTIWPFERSAKAASGRRLVRLGTESRPDIVVMEGSGTAGGAAVLALKRRGVPYIVSSGDAIAPFLRAAKPGIGLAANAYERVLYRGSAGFIGWTPYLVGRALTLGAPRGMTAASWADPAPPGARGAIREELGIDEDHIVFGIAGTLNWDRRGYCYGWELVSALRQTTRRDIHVLIVGDGEGLPHLRDLGGADVGRRLTFTGRVPRERVTSFLDAMDVGSLPQTVDGVGSFRYTTKISEYLVARLPIVMSEIPAAYDLDDGWLWRLPGREPWGSEYIGALAALMSGVTREDVAVKREAIPAALPLFDAARQQRQVVDFVQEAVDAWRESQRAMAST